MPSSDWKHWVGAGTIVAIIVAASIMRTFGYIFEIALGAVFIWMAPAKTLVLRGAFGRGPGVPASLTGRVCIFLIGLLLAVDGLIRLSGGTGLEFKLKG